MQKIHLKVILPDNICDWTFLVLTFTDNDTTCAVQFNIGNGEQKGQWRQYKRKGRRDTMSFRPFLMFISFFGN